MPCAASPAGHTSSGRGSAHASPSLRAPSRVLRRVTEALRWRPGVTLSLRQEFHLHAQLRGDDGREESALPFALPADHTDLRPVDRAVCVIQTEVSDVCKQPLLFSARVCAELARVVRTYRCPALRQSASSSRRQSDHACPCPSTGALGDHRRMHPGRSPRSDCRGHEACPAAATSPRAHRPPVHRRRGSVRSSENARPRGQPSTHVLVLQQPVGTDCGGWVLHVAHNHLRDVARAEYRDG